MSGTIGAPCWIDLYTPDADTAADFYGRLFGWTSTAPAPEFHGYRNLLREGAPVAGLMPDSRITGGTAGGTHRWTVYLESADAADTAARAQAHGGIVALGPAPVADLGVFGLITDPGGATIGVWEPGSHRGFATPRGIGAPVWFENLTLAYDDVVPFYRDVFDWDVHTMSDTPQFRYSTLGEGEGALAGIMDATGFLGESPSRWQAYFEVADTDETVEHCVLSGGAVTQAPEDTPYGRLAALADPSGISFCVMGPTRS